MIVTVTDLYDGVTPEASPVTISVVEGGAGADGASAYEIAVANGFVGTEAEWLASLQGADGAGVVASVVAPLVLTGDVLSLDGSGFETAGASAAAVTAHEAAANPHPTYLTQAEADALYSGSGGAVDSVNGQTGAVVLDADDIADGTTNHAFTAADDTKLAGIAIGATANATDAQLRDRSTHTGTQSADTLTDGTTQKAFLATERTKLAGIATGATANDTDANLKARANHTGTQTAATISDFAEAVDDRVDALVTDGSGIETTYDDTAGTLTVAKGAVTVNAQTGTSYTLVLADRSKFVTMTNAGASTLTVPPNSSVAFPVGTLIEGAQLGAGQVTLTPGSGVTVNGTPGLKVAAQYGTFGLLKTATDTWLAFGRLSA